MSVVVSAKILSKVRGVGLTCTNIASQRSAVRVMRPEEWIVSPASLSTLWTFPHSSILACWRCFQIVETWSLNRIVSAVVIKFDKPVDNDV
jgi:hypothetical protein